MNWLRRRSIPKTPTYRPSEPVVYPAGICVKTEKSHYYLHPSDGKRYRIPTERILQSWNYPLIVETSEAALKNYPVALSKIGFRTGSLLNNIADGKLYLVSGAFLRHIVSPDALVRLGLERSDALTVSDDEINLMKQGDIIR